MRQIQVAGFDVAFANFGMARATVIGGEIECVTDLELVNTEGQNKKVVRKSSDDLRRAQEIQRAMHRFCSPQLWPQGQITLAFAEVPHGSQSARASWSLGIAVGVLASCPIPVIQVSALEVKMATVGSKTASKEDMIDWAVDLYPAANWLRHSGKITNKNEHLADAIAVIHAGIRTDDFKRLLAVISPPLSKRVVSHG